MLGEHHDSNMIAVDCENSTYLETLRLKIELNSFPKLILYLSSYSLVIKTLIE